MIRGQMVRASASAVNLEHRSLGGDRQHRGRTCTTASLARAMRTGRATVFIVCGRIRSVHNSEVRVARHVRAGARVPIHFGRTRQRRDQDDPDKGKHQRVNHGFEHGLTFIA